MKWTLAGTALISLLGSILQVDARAADHPWELTLYVGPSTTKYFGAAIQKLNFEPTSVMAGIALDRPFLDLGWGIEIGAEVQVTGYFFGHQNASFAAGLGFQANEPFGLRNSSLSVYDGPTYATDPPYTSIGYSNNLWPSSRINLLNYVSLEYAWRLTKSSKWDGVFRLYHRSGAFGLYSDGDDDGLSVGVGFRRSF